MMRWTWFWKTLIIFKLQTWLGNARLHLLCFFFCHVFCIEINYIMLSMWKSFDGMVLLVLILSCVGRLMVPMSLLLTMYTFVIDANSTTIIGMFCERFWDFFSPCWLVNSWILHFLIGFYIFIFFFISYMHASMSFETLNCLILPFVINLSFFFSIYYSSTINYIYFVYSIIVYFIYSI